MPVYQINKFSGGISDYDSRGISGSFKFGKNLDIRKEVDSLSCNQALKDIGVVEGDAPSSSASPSASRSPSSSLSLSVSRSISPSASTSPSIGTSPSSSRSPSASRSPSGSASPSASLSPSHSVSPSLSPSSGLLTTFQDLIKFWVKCDDGNTYGFGNTGKIYKIDQYLNCSMVYDAHDLIKGAEQKHSSSGKLYLLFATNTNIHIKEIPGDAAWNDVDSTAGYPKTNLTSADWHTMKEVGGDVLICNKQTIAMVAYDDSYTNEALLLILGNVAKTIVERDGRAIIGAYRASDPTQAINGAIDSEVPLAQIGEDGEIFFANMADSLPVKRFPGGGKVNPGGVVNQVEQATFFEWEQTALSWIDKQTVGNLSLWGVYGADSGRNGIYSLGRKNKNHGFIMNLEYEMDVDEIGAITYANGTLLASYQDGSSFGVKAIDPNNKATAVYEGLDFNAPVKKPVDITQWKTAEILMAPLPSGASVEYHYKLNKNGNFIQARTADDDTSFNTAGAKKAVFRNGSEGEIFEPRVVIIPAGNESPEIYRIRQNFL